MPTYLVSDTTDSCVPSWQSYWWESSNKDHCNHLTFTHLWCSISYYASYWQTWWVQIWRFVVLKLNFAFSSHRQWLLSFFSFMNRWVTACWNCSCIHMEGQHWLFHVPNLHFFDKFFSWGLWQRTAYPRSEKQLRLSEIAAAVIWHLSQLSLGVWFGLLLLPSTIPGPLLIPLLLLWIGNSLGVTI